MESLMRAARLYGPNDIRLMDVPIPDVGPGDVLCKVVSCGMCGTDYAIYSGEFSFVKSGAVRFPMTMGHEWSGVVAQVGSAVTGFDLGDRVVGDTCVSCGVCYDCLIGQYMRCKKMRPVGTIYAWDGAYAEYIVMPARHLFHLPESVSFDNGALIEPAATALYSVSLANVSIGDTVLVHGTGPIGIMAARFAKLSGASKVLITGRKDFKLKKALLMGADVAINVTRESLSETVSAHIGDSGIDCVVEASGSTELFKESLKLVRTGGSIALVAFYEKIVDGFDIDRVVFGDINIRGVAGSLGMYAPVLRLMASGDVDFTPLITGRYTFDEIPQALNDMRAKNDTKIKLMIDFQN